MQLTRTRATPYSFHERTGDKGWSDANLKQELSSFPQSAAPRPRLLHFSAAALTQFDAQKAFYPCARDASRVVCEGPLNPQSAGTLA
ncbi:MAG: hypothetical protein QOJ64_659 [Acidobacteriota bacterium]|nr:hypothetical protein [Acidobacteriota bacterium]